MKKIILFELLFTILIVAIIGALLYRKPVKDVPLTEVKAAFENEADFGEMEDWGDMTLRRNFALDAADYREYLYYGQPDTMSVQVFLLVKCASEEETDQVLKAIDVYLERERKAFEGYGESQTALLKDARIYQKGAYVGLIVAKDADAWEKRLKTLLEDQDGIF